MTKEVALDAGDYPIEWTHSGGDFGCGLLKFIDADTSQLLPIQHTGADLRDVPIDRVVQVSSDKPGWPVLTRWIDRTTESWTPAGENSAAGQRAENSRLLAY